MWNKAKHDLWILKMILIWGRLIHPLLTFYPNNTCIFCKLANAQVNGLVGTLKSVINSSRVRIYGRTVYALFSICLKYVLCWSKSRFLFIVSCSIRILFHYPLLLNTLLNSFNSGYYSDWDVISLTYITLNYIEQDIIKIRMLFKKNRATCTFTSAFQSQTMSDKRLETLQEVLKKNQNISKYRIAKICPSPTPAPFNVGPERVCITFFWINAILSDTIYQHWMGRGGGGKGQYNET